MSEADKKEARRKALNRLTRYVMVVAQGARPSAIDSDQEALRIIAVADALLTRMEQMEALL